MSDTRTVKTTCKCGNPLELEIDVLSAIEATPELKCDVCGADQAMAVLRTLYPHAKSLQGT